MDLCRYLQTAVFVFANSQFPLVISPIHRRNLENVDAAPWAGDLYSITMLNKKTASFSYSHRVCARERTYVTKNL